MLSLLLASSLSLASPVLAHKGCGGHEGLGRRNEFITGPNSAKFMEKRDGNATVTPSCDAYYYAPASALVPKFPTTWQTATIQPGDTAAQDAYNAISAKLNSSFPQDQPHGKPNGDWTGVTYNGGQDPDCWWTYTTCTSPKADTGLPADVTVVPEPGSYGLTVDDGPNCNNGFFYDYLKSNDYKATLFYIGSNVLNWPLQAIRGIEDGHEICVHTWSHQYMTALTNEQVFAELYYTRQMIKDILNVTATCWRPPYGDVDNRVRLVAQELGLQTIIWSEDTDDWSEGSGTPPSKIDANYQAIIDKQKNNSYGGIGPIVLAHELTDFTMNEMIKYLPQIKEVFAHVIPVATALNNTTPYEEKDILYPDFAQFIGGDESVSTTSLAPSASASASGSATSAMSSMASSAVSAASAKASSGSGSNSGKNDASGGSSAANAQPSSAAGQGYTVGGLAGVSLGLMGIAVLW